MRPIETHFADYASHHRNALNKATHSVGIPMIVLALIGLASRVSLFAIDNLLAVNLGLLLVLALVAIYMTWHVGLGLGTALLCVPLYLVALRIPIPWLWVSLAVGVALQYVGHLVFEKRNPAFHKNAVHMLVGPLWIAALLFRSLGLYHPPETAD